MISDVRILHRQVQFAELAEDGVEYYMVAKRKRSVEGLAPKPDDFPISRQLIDLFTNVWSAQDWERILATDDVPGTVLDDLEAAAKTPGHKSAKAMKVLDKIPTYVTLREPTVAQPNIEIPNVFRDALR